jgi:RNA polymerase-binding transcription factor DksA
MMESTQRQEIEKRLLAERARALKALDRMGEDARNGANDDGGLTNYPLHLADEGTDAMQREKELLLMSSEGRRLVEIDEALRRLYRDPENFGRCERCGNEIGFERLSIVPWARRCVACKTLEENAG